MTSGTLSAEAAAEVAELANLLGHPLRVRLMTALAVDGSGSATVFSGQFGDVTVGDCHYHLTALRDGGVVKLVHSRQVRGATERIYRLNPRSRCRAQQLRHFIDLLLTATNSPERETAGVGVSLDHGDGRP